MSKLHELSDIGQSVWIDFISRKLLTSGELKDWIDKGLRGMTSNPTIFDKAISKSDDYDEEIKEYVKQDLSVEEIYEKIVIKDM